MQRGRSKRRFNDELPVGKGISARARSISPVLMKQDSLIVLEDSEDAASTSATTTASGSSWRRSSRMIRARSLSPDGCIASDGMDYDDDDDDDDEEEGGGGDDENHSASHQDAVRGWEHEQETDRQARRLVRQSMRSSLSRMSFMDKGSLFSSSRTLKIKKQMESLRRLFDDEASPKQRGAAAVTFTRVVIHYHDIVMCADPSVSTGVPIALGWRRIDSLKMPVDDFESARPTVPRTNQELKLGPAKRERMLREAGYKTVHIQACLDEIAVLKAKLNHNHDGFGGGGGGRISDSSLSFSSKRKASRQRQHSEPYPRKFFTFLTKALRAKNKGELMQ